MCSYLNCYVVSVKYIPIFDEFKDVELRTTKHICFET